MKEKLLGSIVRQMKNYIGLKLKKIVKYNSVSMIRKKRESGKDSFELTPEKAHRLHDDRSYTCALLGWALSEERRKDLLRRPKLDSQDLVSKLPIRKAKRFNSF